STDRWVDINGMDDEAAARQIQADGIDILVDLNGNTKGSRTKICAMRPAPIIVNWLGFPGTMATPYHHYIIADDWIIPEGHEIFVSEKVVRLPCYQPNDRKRQVSPVRPSRQDARLPEDAMVYCCFNWTQKISRKIFELWMSILRQVPNSVLWLLDTDEETNLYLAGLAASHGIAAERLVFGEWMSSPNHLARYPLADVFLDTYPYGAHTTASDALWMGVPIITLSGNSFASRVCGSLARSAGLPDLVCTTPEDYVALAVDLGHNPEKVLRYKTQLEEGRNSCALFDTDLLARRLEKLYAKMWADYRRGALPRPDLTNLDIYLEAAVEDDLEAADLLGVADYKEWFRQKLAQRHRACPIPDDKRLWKHS
ncbi:MAG TPA: O-linked N-acetylglucosamine transferase, partial [Telmatospirillum sp.]|nr:O-linked N-acetylglucosamine transferase [Telmatospirillum sp.]